MPSAKNKLYGQFGGFCFKKAVRTKPILFAGGRKNHLSSNWAKAQKGASQIYRNGLKHHSYSTSCSGFVILNPIQEFIILLS